ncbi:MAG TPA: hypothetical protein VNQ76_06270, partial [Planctomicrobium sp.]|nr:hypothetical protein [Planctomicrobium sp.]
VDPVIPPSRLCPSIPDDLEKIILQCLAKKPDERIESAHSLEQALSQCGCASEWNDEEARQWWQTSPQDLQPVR